MSPPALPTLKEWLGAQERFGLTLSSGFFGFYAHAGVLTALLEAGLSPSVLSGSSSGAFVAGGFASGVDPEVFEREMTLLSRADFWDPGVGLGFLRGKKFHALLERILPEHAFENTRLPVSISVFELRRMRTAVVSTGPLLEAIRASCAVPGMFHPVRVNGRLCLDGGIKDRPGFLGMADDIPVLFHHLPYNRTHVDIKNMPVRKNTVSLGFNGLPAVGPNQMTQGPVAFHAAYKAAKAALSRPVEPETRLLTDIAT